MSRTPDRASPERAARIASTLTAIRPRTLRHNAAASVARWVVTVAVVVVVFPLMLSRLGTDRFGLWAALTTPTSMLALAGLGVGPATVVLLGHRLSAALVSEDARAAESALRRAGGVCAAALLLSLLAAAVALVVGMMLTQPALDVLGVRGRGEEERFLFRAAVVCLAGMLLGSGLVAQLEGARRVDLSSLSWGTVSVLNAVFLLAAVVVSPGLRALGYVQLLTACVNVIVPGLLIWRAHLFTLWHWLRIDPESVKGLLRLSVSLGGASALSAVIDPLVKFSLGGIAGTGPIAAYELSQRVVQLAAGAFTAALQPIIAHVSGAVGERRLRDVPETVARAVRAVGGLSLPALSALAVAAPSVVAVWLGPTAPHGAALSITLLCPGVAASILATPAYHALQGAGHGMRVLSVQALTVAGVATVLVLCAWGIVGPSYAGALAIGIAMAAGAGLTFLQYWQVYGREAAMSAVRVTAPGLIAVACMAPALVGVALGGLSDLVTLIASAAIGITGALIVGARERVWRPR